MPASRCSVAAVTMLWLLSAAATGNELSGQVVLSRADTRGFAVHHDRFGYAASGPAIRELPAIAFEIVQDGEYLLPVGQGIRDPGHPHWDVAIQPGRIGPADDEGSRRAAFPIALVERNANCTHNGVLSWDVDDTGQISAALWQIALETCAYFKFDLWGEATGNFTAAPSAFADAARRAFHANRRARLPVAPIERIGERYPGIDASAFGAVGDMNPADMTVYGFVIDGIHYRGGCETRHGKYPFCDELLLPSYSTAKSVFAGLAMMRLQKLFPGSAESPVAKLVPACDTDDWRGVTIEHAVDMATGNFSNPGPDVDEASEGQVEFLYDDTHAGKIGRACTMFPRREEPGSRFVYHTSDTYVAGTAMRALLERKLGGTVGLYETLLADPLWHRLDLSPVAGQARTTSDTVRQPWTGWGLAFIADDVVRIANWLNAGRGRLDGEAMLDEALFEAAMQRLPADRGLPAPSPDFRYNNGFWAHDIAPYIRCEWPVWVPFMSGYGGISVVLFPNGTSYYYFSDGYTQRWREAAVASHTIRGMCHDA